MAAWKTALWSRSAQRLDVEIQVPVDHPKLCKGTSLIRRREYEPKTIDRKFTNAAFFVSAHSSSNLTTNFVSAVDVTCRRADQHVVVNAAILQNQRGAKIRGIMCEPTGKKEIKFSVHVDQG